MIGRTHSPPANNKKGQIKNLPFEIRNQILV